MHDAGGWWAVLNMVKDNQDIQSGVVMGVRYSENRRLATVLYPAVTLRVNSLVQPPFSMYGLNEHAVGQFVDIVA